MKDITEVYTQDDISGTLVRLFPVTEHTARTTPAMPFVPSTLVRFFCARLF